MYFVWELVCESCGCLYMYQICVWEWDWREMWGSPCCAWVASCLIIFYCVCEYVLSCPVPVLVLFLGGGWCELVCVCTKERGEFLFGVVWVFLLLINPWGWCHVQVCVQLYDALICISMPAWLFFFFFSSFIHTGAHHFWDICDGCFLVVLAGPCSPFASFSSCQMLLGPGFCCFLIGQSQPSGVVGFKQHQYNSHCRT